MADPSAASGFDLKSLFPLLAGAGAVYGNYANNNSVNNATGNAANMSRFNPTNISGPFGSVNGSIGPNGQPNYNTSLDPALAGPFGQFAGLAGQFGANAAGAAGQNNPISSLPGQVSGAFDSANQALNQQAPNFFAPFGQQGFQGLAGQAGQLANTAGTAAQNTLGGPNTQGNAGNQFLNAGGNYLSALQQFNPQQFAQDQYSKLAALAAPGQTDQTQAMLNYEQASGRGGLTQNGQLGDMGGLALSQNLADQNRQLQAVQSGQQQQSLLAGLSSGLSSQGSNLIGAGQANQLGALNLASSGQGLAQGADTYGYNRLLQQNLLNQNAANQRFSNAGNALSLGEGAISNNVSNATQANQGALGINQGLLASLQSSLGASVGAANAGAQAGGYLTQGAMNSANNNGSLLGGLLQGMNAQGGLGGPLGSLNNMSRLYSAGQNLYGGLSTGLSNLLYGPAYTDQSWVQNGLNNYGGGSQGFGDAFDSAMSNNNNANDQSQLFGDSFNGAGGQAANPDDETSVFNDALNSQASGSGNSAGGGMSLSGLRAGIGDAQSGLGVVSGLQQGGTAGYGSALANGANLLQASGLVGDTAANALGAAGNLASGNLFGAARNAYGAYSAATAQAGMTTAQAAADAAASQAAGQGAATAATTSSTAGAANAVSGALTSAVPAFLAYQLIDGLMNHSTDPGAMAQRSEWASESHQNASLEGWLGTNGTPALHGVSGDGSAKYPTTYTLADGTQLNGSQWDNLVGMYSRMNNPYNKGTSYTAPQIQQYIASLPKNMSALAPTQEQIDAANKYQAAVPPWLLSALQQGNAQYNPGAYTG